MPTLIQPHHSPPPATCEPDAIEKHLVRHLRNRLHEVNLFVREGGVVIRGVANSYYVKQLAQHAVMQRALLPIAANEIVIRGALNSESHGAIDRH